ncbi:MAG: helix-turn-helix domain-containing protein [Pyrinomonadaceae bacterium]
MAREEIRAPEAADLLGISRDYVIKLARRGIVQGEKKGRDWWIDKQSLLEF